MAIGKPLHKSYCHEPSILFITGCHGNRKVTNVCIFSIILMFITTKLQLKLQNGKVLFQLCRTYTFQALYVYISVY